MANKNDRRVVSDLPWTTFGFEADKDYLLARWIHFSGDAFTSRAGFFAQQACEKYMKAEMVLSTGSFLKTHRLNDLANDCATRRPMFKNPKLRYALSEFDDFAEVGRYGAFAGKNQLKVAPDTGVKVLGASMWTSNSLCRLDEFAFNVRRQLDFAKGGFRDQLHAIITDDQTAMLVNLWKGSPTLKDVLLRENPLFSSLTPSL